MDFTISERKARSLVLSEEEFEKEFKIEPKPANTIESHDIILDRVSDRVKHIGVQYLKLGQDLFLIYNLQLYKKLDKDYQSYGEYVVKELGFSEDMGNKLRRLWKKYVKNLNLKQDDFEGIGFTKALKLMPIVNKDNVQDWLDKARNKSGKELDKDIEEVKKKIPKFKSVDISYVEAKAPELISNRPIETAEQQKVFNIENNPKTIEVTPDNIELSEETLIKKTFYLYPDQVRILNDALESIERETNSTKDSFNLTCAIAEFIANRNVISKKEDKPYAFMKAFEERFGGKLMWVKNRNAADKLNDLISKDPELKGDIIYDNE